MAGFPKPGDRSGAICYNSDIFNSNLPSTSLLSPLGFPKMTRSNTSSNNYRNTFNHCNKRLITAGYMLGYFTTSIMTNIFTTFLFNKKQYHFPFPLLAGSAFDVIQTLMASIGLVILMKDPTAPIKVYKNISRRKYLTTIVPCAIAFSLDIALSNSSLKHISLSMYTMVKSSAPVFVMISSFIFGLEKPSLSLILIITIIAFGTILTFREEFKFNLYGILLCFAAALSSGIRWSLTQIIIEYNLFSLEDQEELQSCPLKKFERQDENEQLCSNSNSPSLSHKKLNFQQTQQCRKDSKETEKEEKEASEMEIEMAKERIKKEIEMEKDITTGPIHTIFFLSPIIAIILGIFSLILDGPSSIVHSDHFNNFHSLGVTSILFMIGGIITFVLILAEYKVVEDTSVLTFSISGIIKELVIIGLSVAIFKDNLTIMNYVGAGLSIFGILLYHYHRTKSIKSDILINDIDLQRIRIESVITTDPNVFITSFTNDRYHQIMTCSSFPKREEVNQGIDTITINDLDRKMKQERGVGRDYSCQGKNNHFRNRSISFTGGGGNEILKSCHGDKIANSTTSATINDRHERGNKSKKRSGSLDRSLHSNQND